MQAYEYSYKATDRREMFVHAIDAVNAAIDLLHSVDPEPVKHERARYVADLAEHGWVEIWGDEEFVSVSTREIVTGYEPKTKPEPVNDPVQDAWNVGYDATSQAVNDIFKGRAHHVVFSAWERGELPNPSALDRVAIDVPEGDVVVIGTSSCDGEGWTYETFGPLTWRDLLPIAEAAIKDTGDMHHVFLESVYTARTARYRSDVDYVLGFGS